MSSLFSGENEKNIVNLSAAELAQLINSNNSYIQYLVVVFAVRNANP